MSQETAPTSASPPATRGKKNVLRTTLLLLLLLGISLVAADRALEGKLFTNLKNGVATTIGGGMKDEQQRTVDQFRNRLTNLRSQRETLATGETMQPPAASPSTSKEKAASPSAPDSESSSASEP
jgi:hypothetical protein